MRTEGNGMGKRRRRLISIPLLSSFSTSKGFRSSHGSDLEEEEEEQRGTKQPWHFPPFLRFLRTKKDKKRRFIKASGPSSSFYLSHFLLLFLSPLRLWWPKVAKIRHPTGGREGNLWHQGGGFAKHGEKRSIFLSFLSANFSSGHKLAKS